MTITLSSPILPRHFPHLSLTQLVGPKPSTQPICHDLSNPRPKRPGQLTAAHQGHFPYDHWLSIGDQSSQFRGDSKFDRVFPEAVQIFPMQYYDRYVSGRIYTSPALTARYWQHLSENLSREKIISQQIDSNDAWLALLLLFTYLFMESCTLKYLGKCDGIITGVSVSIQKQSLWLWSGRATSTGIQIITVMLLIYKLSNAIIKLFLFSRTFAYLSSCSLSSGSYFMVGQSRRAGPSIPQLSGPPAAIRAKLQGRVCRGLGHMGLRTTTQRMGQEVGPNHWPEQSLGNFYTLVVIINQQHSNLEPC